METKYFNFTDVLGYGWRVMKANFWFFVGLGLIWLVITYIPAAIDLTLRLSRPSPAIYLCSHIAIRILGWLVGIIFGIGLTKIALAFCDERKPAIGTLFDAWDCFWRYLGAAILYGLIVLGGILLLIIPGIIWAVKFSLCFYFVIDKGLDPIEALRASARTTMGAKWQLFGFGFLCGLINLLGLLCLIVGIFATYPTVLVAHALVYRQLSAQTPQLAEFGITTPIEQPVNESWPNGQE